jgi:hypothetical protein
MNNYFYKALIVLSIAAHSQLSYPTLITLQSFKTERGGLKEEFLSYLKQCFNKAIFFETGTYSGDTTEKATLVFNEVHSTELSEKIYREAVRRFNNNKNVHLHYGDSPTLLAQILPTISKEIIFWLDAHYCGIGTGRGRSDCPLLEELEAIRLSNKSNSVIMIDDLRSFYSENWPSLSSAIQLLKTINPDYTIIAYGDALIAYPNTITASDCLQACSISRLFDAQPFDYSLDTVLKAEEIIAAADGAELDALSRFFYYIRESEDQYGMLWQALIFEHNEQYQQAYTLYEKLLIPFNGRSINHWRINWYLARTAFKLNKFGRSKNELQQIILHHPDFTPAHALLAILHQ